MKFSSFDRAIRRVPVIVMLSFSVCVGTPASALTTTSPMASISAPVEVAALTTATQQILRNPDGTFTGVFNTGPARWRDEQGRWRAIDLNLSRTNGRLHPASAPHDVTIREDTAAIAVTTPTGAFTLREEVSTVTRKSL